MLTTIRGKEYIVCGTPDTKDLNNLSNNHHMAAIPKNKIKVNTIKTKNYTYKGEFWYKFHNSDIDTRISMLIEMCKVKLEFDRNRYIRLRNRKYNPDGKCLVCGSTPSCKHHVVPLINGGASNKNNMVNICSICHSRVHPWLENRYRSY